MLSCQNKHQGDGKFRIVTTTMMLNDLATSLTHDIEQVEVVALMGPGVDPHLYKATQSDLSTLRRADIVLYNGLHLEGKMGEVLEKLKRMQNQQVLAVGETIPKTKLILAQEQSSTLDPHVWFDIALWATTIDTIAHEFIQLLPHEKDIILENAQVKKNTLLELDKKVRKQISSIPERQRVLITAHDAFTYFGKAYNIEVKGLQGISTLAEPGVKDVKDLVDFIIERNIKAVFVESSVSKKSIKAIQEGVEKQGYKISIGGTLYSDAMGEMDTDEGTYEGMVNHNVNTIVNALQ